MARRKKNPANWSEGQTPDTVNASARLLMTRVAEMTAKPQTAFHDVWMYGPEGARLFKSGEIIPSGYCDSPAKVDRK